MRATLLFTVFICMACHHVNAQNPALKAFTGTQVKDSVYLFFTMNGGYTCNGIGIERSADSVVFQEIGDIQGVCGDPTNDADFEFVDIAPMTGINYYRLDMGNWGWSQVIAVTFRPGRNKGVALSANPCMHPCILYFEPQKTVRLLLSDNSGQVVVDASASGESFSLAPYDLPAGIYHYRLAAGDGSEWAGSFAVAR